MAFIRRSRVPFAGLLALVLTLVFTAGHVQAQEMDCALLMDDVKAGKLYAVTRLEDKGQVKIEAIKGHCFEPIATWDARGLPMASLGSGAFIPPPRKKKKTTPPPITGFDNESDLPILQKRMTEPPPTSDYYSGGGSGVLPHPDRPKPAEEAPAAPEDDPDKTKTHVGTGAPAEGPVEGQEGQEGQAEGADTSADLQPPAGEKAPDTHDRCDRTVHDFWGPGEIDIKGSKYYLSGAFTVDKDGDGWVDNVGFKLKLVGRVGNVIRYFDTPGRLSGQTTPDLKLRDDDDISRLCAGDVMFDLPKRFLPKEEEPEKKPEEPAKEPEKEEPAEEPVEEPKKEDFRPLIVISVAGFMLMVSGLVTLFLLQPELAARREKKKQDEEAKKKAESGEDGEGEEAES